MGNATGHEVRLRKAAGTALLGFALLCDGARGQPVDGSAFDTRPAQSAAVEPEDGSATPPSIRSSLGASGDPGGIRGALERHVVTATFAYTNEVLANGSGGFRQGSIYAGKLEAIVTADLGQLAGVDGVAFFANAFQIHDTGGLRDRSFGRLTTISNIEAYPSTRLSELWLERKWPAAQTSLRVGQIVADGEFFSSDVGKLFVSNDWPTITGANLPSGGPAYPVAAPGVRLRWDVDLRTSALLALFDGVPGDQQFVNRTGTNFPLRDAPLLMGEVQSRFGEAAGHATSLKFGGWQHFGRFADQRFDIVGRPLADPAGSGIARQWRGTSGLYGVLDVQLWRPDGGAPTDGVLAYVRAAVSPSDRSLVDRWADGGLVVAGLVPARPADTFGVSFIYTGIGAGARGYDLDLQRLAGSRQAARRYGATVELSYQAQIVPGWLIQPDLQYVIEPTGLVAPAGHGIRGGVVFGLRSTLVY